MRVLLQRVTRASVRIDGRTVAEIGGGLVLFVGVGASDGDADADAMAVRVAGLRIFADDARRTNRSILEAGGAALVVSQFTLYADTSRGRRPGFSGAAAAEVAERIYGRFADGLRVAGIDPVRSGRFGEAMEVELVNDGPFTIWLDSAAR